jgi:hypothetical protein
MLVIGLLVIGFDSISRLEVGSWQLGIVGSWAVGSWKLEVGNGQLAMAEILRVYFLVP